MAIVTADLKACQGYANCVIEAPDFFGLDDDGVVELLRREIPDEERDRIVAAAESCPVRALTVIDG